MASSEVRGLRLLHVLESGINTMSEVELKAFWSAESDMSLLAEGVAPRDEASADITWFVCDDGEEFEATDSDIFARAVAVLTRGGTIPAALMIVGGRRSLFIFDAVDRDVAHLVLLGFGAFAAAIVEGPGSG
jgi:hypothetical protein